MSRVPELRFPGFTKEWTEVRLGDVASFLKGKGISKNDVIEDENGVFCIRYGQLYTDFGEVIKRPICRTKKSDDLVFGSYNDVLIPSSGETILDIATASCLAIKEDVAIGGDINIIRSNELNGIFLAHYLNHQKRISIAKLAQGISVVHLYATHLKNLKISIPSLSEQQKIADFLTAVDEKIETVEAKIDRLERYKKGAMQKLLSGEVRFPGFTEEWKVVKLSALIQIKRGASPRPISDYITNDPNGINWIKIGDVDRNSKYIINTSEKITPEGALKSQEVNPGDFLLSNSMSYGRPYISKIHGCIHDGWLLLRNLNKNVLSNDYLYIIMSSFFVKKQLLSLAAGTGVKNLKSETVKQVKILLPSLPEQQKIADFLTAIDDRIDTEKTRLEALKSYKKGLLQKMFV